MKSRLFVLLYALLAVYITLNRGVWKEHQVIVWDGTGYYMYLPAFFIYQDQAQLRFYREIDSVYSPSGGLLQYGIHSHKATGRRSMRYPIGVAILQAPGFLLAHAITKAATDYPPDGYSAPYQLAVALSAVLWATIGLLFLRRFLLLFFPEPVVWKALLLISLGTNFYYYTAFFQGWSHAYSFFAFAAILFFTERWYRNTTPGYALALALSLGLAVIIRPSNIVIAVIPLLWRAGPEGGIFPFWLKHRGQIGLAAVAFVLVLSIQLGYWKYATGQWVYYSYTDEGFDFLRPKIWKGLFSYRKGWFVYTPLALFFCAGFIPLFKRRGRLFLPALAFILLHVYVVFSWRIWHYASAFSCRPMVEAMAVLSIPACGLIESVGGWRRSAARVGAWTVGLALLALNIFQTYQYSLKIIHFDRMTRAYYWRVFGKLSVTEEDRMLLRQQHEDEPDR